MSMLVRPGAQDATVRQAQPSYDGSLANTDLIAMPTTQATSRSMVLALMASLAVAGCGAEVAGGAATVGTLQSTAAKQAQAQQSKVVDGMKAAQDAGMARAASAAD